MNHSNNLKEETSPYLLQHAHNPVNWYPWGKKAFDKAKIENKPIFLSIGYSTCHWCHVMKQECFENEHLANLLNDNFVSIKVDKEERPDIDTIYMRVCQAFTGSGGWPTSIFMTADQKPFFAGTYFPLENFTLLLNNIKINWQYNKEKLINDSDKFTHYLNHEMTQNSQKKTNLSQLAFNDFEQKFDKEYGGFGDAPKFPSPHNLLFLMKYSKCSNENTALKMVEDTLIKMYKGGIFDHIGYGFSRYSTDKKWLVPHFEKMLYDNALLAVTYLTAFEQTKNKFYKSIADKIFTYIKREMTDKQGAFYSAQDADSEGVEGKYYVFTPDEIIDILDKSDGEKFNKQYNITIKGNFEGKNIPNLITENNPFVDLKELSNKLYKYRKTRVLLHRDDKILLSWNSLMLWAYACAYRIVKNKKYLNMAQKSFEFIENTLIKNDVCYAGITNKKLLIKGFLDNYAFYILALIELYHATFDKKYLTRALLLTHKTVKDFYDYDHGGFYFYENNAEQLILRPKECYDGAIPSGNSVMTYVLDRLYKLTKDKNLYDLLIKQKKFMNEKSSEYPSGFCFFLMSTLPTKDFICVLKNKEDLSKIKVKSHMVFRVLEEATNEYKLINNKTTFYICENNHCLQATNELKDLF